MSPSYQYPGALEAPHGPFEAIADRQEQAQQKDTPLTAVIDLKVKERSPIRLSTTQHTETTGVSMLQLSVGSATSTSFNNHPDGHGEETIAGFHFCPGADTVKVGWKLLHPECIQSAVLELYAARLDQVIAKKTIAKSALSTGGGGGLSGSTDLANLQWEGSLQQTFPDSVFTVEHSPYRAVLKITTAQRSLHADTAWTFFHVLLSKITVDLGQRAQIPARAQGDEVADHFAKDDRALDLERDLLEDLRGKYVDQGAITTKDLEVVLECNLVKGYIPDDEELSKDLNSNGPGSHFALGAVWGKGPRIPLVARTRVRRADGSDASAVQSKAALGRPWFIWDWDDDRYACAQWVDLEENGNSWITQEYLERVTQEEADGDYPGGSGNCPKKYGGRRGDGQWPVFPDQADGGALGYEVKQAGDARPWAALSRAGAGQRKGSTGVVFQPSCVLGDNYQVYASLTCKPGDEDKDDKPCLVAADPKDSSLAFAVNQEAQEGISTPPMFVTGRFINYRRSKVKLLTVGQTDDDMIDEVVAYYKKTAGFVLDVDKVAMPQDVWSTNNRWTNYSTYFQMGEPSIAALCIDDPQPAQLGQMLVESTSLDDLLQLIQGRLLAGGVYSTLRDDPPKNFGEEVNFSRGRRAYVLAHLTHGDDGQIPQGRHRCLYLPQQANGTLPVYRVRFNAVTYTQSPPANRVPRRHRDVLVTFSVGQQSEDYTVGFGSWRSSLTDALKQGLNTALGRLMNTLGGGLHALGVEIKAKAGARLDPLQKKF